MVSELPQPQAVPTWTVGIPRQTTIPDPQRGYVPGWEVPITLADGSGFTLTVPIQDFNPDRIKQLVEQHYTNLIQIRSLQGDPLPY